MIIYLIVAVVVIAVLVFVPFLRRALGLIFTIVITLGSVFAAAAGIAILMNDVAINERPGMSARFHRFLGSNWATTSDRGVGALTCEETDKNAGEQTENLTPVAAPLPVKAKGKLAPATAVPTATPTPEPVVSAAGPEIYPELVQRGFPGLTRIKLFELSQETVNELGGWKIVKDDKAAFTLECVYTTRLFHWNDDVRITVTPRGEIHLCSHSRVGKGDFGANIGHIKEFYTTLEPKVDAAYKEEEKKQGQDPPGRSSSPLAARL